MKLKHFGASLPRLLRAPVARRHWQWPSCYLADSVKVDDWKYRKFLNTT